MGPKVLNLIEQLNKLKSTLLVGCWEYNFNENYNEEASTFLSVKLTEVPLQSFQLVQGISFKSSFVDDVKFSGLSYLQNVSGFRQFDEAWYLDVCSCFTNSILSTSNKCFKQKLSICLNLPKYYQKLKSCL